MDRDGLSRTRRRMPPPLGFSWIEKPVLAASARPEAPDELSWLREQSIQLIVTLSEDPLPRLWVNDAGLFAMHVPVEDMHPPSQKQIDLIISAIDKAKSRNMGVAIHCTAGLGRTGTIVACYLVHQGMTGASALANIRDLRPGSVETEEQVEAVMEYARRTRTGA
jgi:atypical dual specificity phosphatase